MMETTTEPEVRRAIRSCEVVASDEQIVYQRMIDKGNRVIAAVCLATGVQQYDLLGPRRKKHIVQARHAAAIVMSRRYKIRMKNIASILNLRCHTTIVHAMKKANDPDMKALVEFVDAKLDSRLSRR
jgi:chromosomal replication initiation ATPase DnaA